ncbi:23S rRNA (cytidine(2498)-2'-O)-methyltransferase RlmM [Alkalilimnicola sp. S0819]|uniref:23S rRNA (cytidine(2498)-2'-O)-methyltransferase RlmM n=1 Tax=Alkalilimnicola sp. S0819 TaxID=2613922 RepID=UPI0012618992|nr:23S rRNA (cytidine(2498)-2'-O)-methyltransferase RlmM [Alkalilimnicola sp. S0819]KAB7622586.1 23S rRNA (cytidine(2498)-2'-O)-methyltransferase RlmM [Alkalilimnicola sp. S0819]MPQ17476.1 23S rRNA (cytidine(2498)-2'-O)-methyltransferase RlmM [Alkalilimnicola sp. S0819]
MNPSDTDTTLLLQCRPGLEHDTAAEVTERAAEADLPGYCRTRDGEGWLQFHPALPAQPRALGQALPWRELVFARQCFVSQCTFEALPAQNRADPLAQAAAGLLRQYDALYLEHPDTNEGKSLSGFLRKFRRPLEAALLKAGLRPRRGAPNLHLFFLDSGRVYLGSSAPGQAAPWPLGIPRLRMPGGAPSRSTLKLDEAIQLFLGEDAGRLMAPGMRAVDLGAAPGGWTWQLVRRGLHVTAIDNGPVDAALMADGLVEHLRSDGFRYRPPRPVDWLVCDMVEQPSRIAELMGQWLARGDARAAIFNLKLPMKKRWAAVQDAQARLHRQLERGGRRAQLCAKQLYHDREEITVYARAVD